MEKIKDFSYEPGAEYTITYKNYIGITQAERNTTTNTLDHSWSADGKAEFTQGPVKVALGSSYTEKLSTSTIQVNEYSQNAWYETDESLVFKSQTSVRFIVYELVDRYYTKRMNGTNVNDPLEIFNIAFYKFRTWTSNPIIVSENPTLHTTTIKDDYTPQNFSIGASNNHPYLQWNANTLPNLAYYELWKKWGREGGDWHVKATLSAAVNSYLDESETIAPGSEQATNEGFAYYKIRAADITGNFSLFSNQLSTKVFVDEPSKQAAVKGGVTEQKSISDYSLSQNYPNPFNPSTSIYYQVKEKGLVSLKIYDMLGREVANLVNETKETGSYTINFNASNLPSGIYIYSLRVNNFVQNNKMTLIK